ncbi:hypothetical protein ZWY2020_009862 [Hordeum vulgare]|nr:hypothetical protein ZWY2020_009862 [Hordeum vulgare]
MRMVVAVDGAVQEEGSAVDFMESSQPKETRGSCYVWWHDDATTEYLHDLVGHMRDAVWRLQGQVTTQMK